MSSRRHLPVRTDNNPVTSLAPKLPQTPLYGCVGSRSAAHEVRRNAPIPPAAGAAGGRTVKVHLNVFSRAASEFLQEGYQLHFVVRRFQLQACLRDQIMAIDQVRHRPIVLAGARIASSARYALQRR
jgi:hypothetical protein